MAGLPPKTVNRAGSTQFAQQFLAACRLCRLEPMLNVLSNMVGGTRRWERCSWLWWRHTGGTDPAIGATIIHNVSKTLACDVLKVDRAGVPWRSWVQVHITGLG